jgi:hypothetical protein
MALDSGLVRRLLDCCFRFRERAIGIEEFQAEVRNTENMITSWEERELRKLLHGAEAQLELIRFAVAESNAFAEALKVVSQIEAVVGEWGGESSTGHG